ncbi:MAG: hypothetical protein R3A51_23165 [Nannocystaceae bacterium]|nr:hypothetical protein [Myxococcales bacterium]
MSKTSSGAKGATTDEFVAELAQHFRAQVRRSISTELDDSVVSLAFVDHYLASARDEAREPILALLAAGAGAYYGELVRREFGGQWIGDGEHPRRLRLLLTPQFVHFSPVDQALEAIVGRSLAPDDPRIPPGPPLDASFHLDARPPGADERARADARGPSDEDWIHAQLERLPAISADAFYSLTGRFETLQLILELLAARRLEEGCEPRTYETRDYLGALAAEVREGPVGRG